MAEILTDHQGTCTLRDCAVAGLGGKCLLGLPPIDCEHFEPQPDQGASPAGNELESTPLAREPAPNKEPSLPQMQEQARSSDAAAALADPLLGAVGAVADEGATEIVRQPRRVRRPEGPTDTMVFDGTSVPLPSGLALTADEARSILASDSAILVVVAGPPDAGKTTLLAAIYEVFLRGPISSWSFAGSRSLLAFCQRAYWASTASGGVRPATPRTRYDTTRPWLHLRLADPAGVKSLLIADISGEYFSTLASGGNLGDAASIVARADHVVHVLDSELLVERRERLRALGSTESLIRRMAEQNHFDARAKHTVVLTKADLCPPDFRDEALSRADGWTRRWLPGAEVIEVAARPANHDLPWGLDVLLGSVLSTGERPTARQGSDGAAMRPLMRRLGRTGATIHPLTGIAAGLKGWPSEGGGDQ